MKIIVIGGTGLIGSRVVAYLRGGGHDVLAAPNQPIGGDDVAAIVADVGLAAARNGFIANAAPERAPFNEIVARYLKAVGDPRTVVSDPEARYHSPGQGALARAVGRGGSAASVWTNDLRRPQAVA